MRSRWEELALAQRRGVPIPPIDVYRVNGEHFVSDGHHRVSIALATGQEMIDAYVTEIFTTWAAPEETGPVTIYVIADGHRPAAYGRPTRPGAAQAAAPGQVPGGRA